MFLIKYQQKFLIHLKKIYLVYFLGIFAALSESLGVTILMPYLAGSLSQSEGVSFPIGIENLNSTFYNFFNNFSPLTIAIMFIMIYFIKSGLVFFAQFIAAQFRGLFLKKIKFVLFKNLLNVKYQYYITLFLFPFLLVFLF